MGIHLLWLLTRQLRNTHAWLADRDGMVGHEQFGRVEAGTTLARTLRLRKNSVPNKSVQSSFAMRASCVMPRIFFNSRLRNTLLA